MPHTTTIQEALTTLANGGIIAYPTEAVYGIGCDPSCRTAVEKIAQIKMRDAHKSFILVASQASQLKPFCDVAQSDFYQDIQDSWPGPHTWVFSANDTCPQWLCNSDNSIAVRISSHPTVVELCDAFDGALVSTSANLSGNDPALSADQVHTIFQDAIDFVLPGDVGGLQRPTTIRDARNGEVIRS